jgi:hypothetical protein
MTCEKYLIFPMINGHFIYKRIIIVFVVSTNAAEIIQVMDNLHPWKRMRSIEFWVSVPYMILPTKIVLKLLF